MAPNGNQLKCGEIGLAVAIFKRARLDMRHPRFRYDIRAFLDSPYCGRLLVGLFEAMGRECDARQVVCGMIERLEAQKERG